MERKDPVRLYPTRSPGAFHAQRHVNARPCARIRTSSARHVSAPTEATPWSEHEIRLVLNSHRSKEYTPAKVQSTWNTFKFFSKKLGLVPPDALSALKEKKDAIAVALTPLVRSPQRKSVVPPIQVLVLLEHGCVGLDTMVSTIRSSSWPPWTL